MIGGRPARIFCTVPAGTVESIPSLPGAVGYRHGPGRSVVITTTDLPPTLAALMEWAGSRGLTFESLNARQATLEEAFLAVAASEASLSGQESA